MDDDFVIYREGYAGRKLEYIRARIWDEYLRETPNTNCEFISRGHSFSEAVNLTMLVNQQKEMENEDG